MRKTGKVYSEKEYKNGIWKLTFGSFVVISLTNMGLLRILEHFLSFDSLPHNFVSAAIFYAVFVAIIETIFSYFVVKRYLLKPISKLDEAAEQVARGDFTVYVEPSKKTRGYSPLDPLIENFNTMVDDLSSLETMKTDFISNVSHEIRTPLGNIKNYAYALKDENLTPEQRQEYADTIIEASDKLNTMVTNILKLNRLENQTAKPVTEEYDLCEQLSESVLSFESLWTKKDIEIEMNIEDRAMISADKDMLYIVWQNLFSNAFKFTENGGKVSINQTSDSESVTITITDTGCGMSEETQRRMFDKFYQGDTSHSSEGNGLGMALVFRIIQLIKGELTVESEINKGTSFTVRLPRK